MKKDLWARISNGDDSAYRELYNSSADICNIYKKNFFYRATTQ